MTSQPGGPWGKPLDQYPRHGSYSAYWDHQKAVLAGSFNVETLTHLEAIGSGEYVREVAERHTDRLLRWVACTITGDMAPLVQRGDALDHTRALEWLVRNGHARTAIELIATLPE